MTFSLPYFQRSSFSTIFIRFITLFFEIKHVFLTASVFMFFVFFSAEQQRRAAVQKACTAVGSVSDSCFDVRFNPNVCSPGTDSLKHTCWSSSINSIMRLSWASLLTAGVTFPSECVEELHSQRQLLWSAAAFLLSEQIPAAVSCVFRSNKFCVYHVMKYSVSLSVLQLRDCLDHTANPMDGASLTAVLHQRGVNVRYLGSVLMKLDMMEEKVRLRHVQVFHTLTTLILNPFFLKLKQIYIYKWVPF